MNNIIDLAQARVNRSNLKIQIIRSEKRAGGSYPFLAAATDGHDYWCKAINNPQGPEVPVNEVAAAIVGDRIQSPMPRWAILDVPDGLRGYRTKNYTLTGEPVFGSQVVHTSDVYSLDDTDVLAHVADDSNYNRIPKLYAHWLLCNAEDIQVMYNYEDDHSIISIDHGFWFGSHEFPWGFGSHTQLAGRPSLPAIRKEIPKDQWDLAIKSLEALDDTLFDDLKKTIPESWNIEEKMLKKIASYVLERKDYTIEQLQERQRWTQRR